MKAGFYPRLAFDGIRKNRQMYFPYIMTCIAMVMVYYIILFLSDIRGKTTKLFMDVGSWVIAIFSVIFLFYTNSFLLRRRKKEFGLYNILGMEKRHISLILLWENLIIYALSVVSGLVIGIAFSKIAELAFMKATSGEVTYDFPISFDSVIQTALLFTVIFIMLFLNGLRQIRFSNTITLLQSEALGEKPPKANWFLGILGLVLIAGGYAISLSIDDPVAAVWGFLVAVILVIVGTYITFVAGSVLLCKILRKNKRYYYKANHFVSVSSMAYRMNRNGAGLASICILASMALVTISSTVSLYVGNENDIRSLFPREINITYYYESLDEDIEKDIESLTPEIMAVCEKYNITPFNVIDYQSAGIYALIQGNTVETDSDIVYNSDEWYTGSSLVDCYFIPLEDYNRMMGTTYELSENEALLYSDSYEYNEKSISFRHGNTLEIKQQLDSMFLPVVSLDGAAPAVFLIVPDISYATQGLNSNSIVGYYWHYRFDTGLNSTDQVTLSDSLINQLSHRDSFERHLFNGVDIDCRGYYSGSFYQEYGSLLYLGIVLCFVFLMAAVLIIYYRQISEGYEDQKRFDIMQKVGMTKCEIRKSINSQLLTVFFLPLIFAGLHLAFAFPIISKLLELFGSVNSRLLIMTIAACFVVFALFYVVVYKITSNAYYRIVSDNTES